MVYYNTHACLLFPLQGDMQRLTKRNGFLLFSMFSQARCTYLANFIKISMSVMVTEQGRESVRDCVCRVLFSI